MAADERRKPVTVCTNCGTYGHSIQLANQRCGQRRGKKRCDGVNGSAIGNNDWAECRACNGSGMHGTEQMLRLPALRLGLRAPSVNRWSFLRIAKSCGLV